MISSVHINNCYKSYLCNNELLFHFVRVADSKVDGMLLNCVLKKHRRTIPGKLGKLNLLMEIM